jgi:hypothetical protein
VDVFDAMTTTRPYRKHNYTKEEALSFMLEKEKEDFDPLILKIFSDMIGICPVGSLVLMDSGEIGVVFEKNTESKFIMRPQVKLVSDENGNKMDGDIVDLTEKDEQGRYKRSLLKTLDPRKYDIQTADYFVAEAE